MTNEIKDATQYDCWDQFVNLYRQVHGSNEDLDKPFIRNMSENHLQTAIINMQGLLNVEKYEVRPCEECGEPVTSYVVAGQRGYNFKCDNCKN